MSNARREDLFYFRGETETLTIPVNDEGGAAIDISAYSVEVGIRYREDTPATYTATQAASEVTPGATGLVWAVPTDYAAGVYSWWARITDDGAGGNRVLYTGTFTIEEL